MTDAHSGAEAPSAPLARAALDEKLRQALADADVAFTVTGDVMEALGWVRFAARHGLPLPPAIGRWLASAIEHYERTDSTMDELLGLRGKGPSNPRFNRRAANAKQAAIAQMALLVSVGANVSDAADLVASLGDFKYRTLLDGYRQSNFHREPECLRRRWPPRRADIEALLDPYPDARGLLVTQAKARIRSKCGY